MKRLLILCGLVAAGCAFGARPAVNLPTLKFEQEQAVKRLAGVDSLDKLTPAQEKCVREFFYTVNEKAVLELAGVDDPAQLSKDQREAYKKLNEYTGLCPLKPEWTKQLTENLAGGLPAKVSKPRRLLVFYRCDGFCHRQSIVAGNEAIRLAAEQLGAWQVDFSDDYMALQPYNLEKYDAVVLNNTTNLKTDKYRYVSSALIDFVKYGKGLAVIHAGDDGFNESPELLYMIGGRFCGHPWGGGGTWRFKVEDPASRLAQMFPKDGFSFSDEIYMQAPPYFSRQALHVLVSLDLDDPATKGALDKSTINRRPDGDYAVAWVRTYGRGRLFYSSFGHDERAWLNKPTMLHLLGGIQFALRDLDVETRPSSPVFEPPPAKK